jgi:hypothetical protein
MEKRMREPYTEGVATHGDPESCVVVRKDGDEALTGARVGWAIEPRNQGSGVPTPLTGPEGNIVGSVTRELLVDPARSKNLCMRGIFMRENREVPRLARLTDHGRAAQARLRS